MNFLSSWFLLGGCFFSIFLFLVSFLFKQIVVHFLVKSGFFFIYKLFSTGSTRNIFIFFKIIPSGVQCIVKFHVPDVRHPVGIGDCRAFHLCP